MVDDGSWQRIDDYYAPDLFHFCVWVPSPGWEDPLEEVIATIPIFLPGKSHGQRSLVGYSPWGCRVRHELETKQTKQKTSLKIALLKICGWTCFGNHFRLVKKYLREYNDFPCTINLGSPNSNIHIAMMYWLKLRN